MLNLRYLIEGKSVEISRRNIALIGILEIEQDYGVRHMIDYIPFSTALQSLAVVYILSALVLLAASYIGWTVIETLEESGKF